jgi:hypothetical protein
MNLPYTFGPAFHKYTEQEIINAKSQVPGNKIMKLSTKKERINDAARAGKNILEIQVTSAWVNLIQVTN